MKYNRTLDFMVLSMNAMKHGKGALAAKLFAKAATQDDVEDAIRILEASNARAHELEAETKKLAAAKKVEAKPAAKKVEAKPAAKPVVAKKETSPAAKRLAASEDIPVDDVPEGTNDGEIDESELGADLVDDDELAMDNEDEEQLAGDLSELEDGADEATDDSVDVSEEFAAVLASMQRKAGRK